MNIWLEAVRQKLRFSYSGIISVEDLFDLKLSNLDSIYQQLNKKLQDISGKSLLDNGNKDEIEILQLKIDIVKSIFDIKQKEAKALEQKIANLQEKQKIMRIINEKEDAELADLSIDELKDKLKDLE